MRIVVWSGGADSTLILLNEVLRTHGKDVVALTLEHAQINDQPQRSLQDAARERFKRWLWKMHRINVTHRTIRVVLPDEYGAEDGVGQHGLFLFHLFPYMIPPPGKKSTVLFGHIRGDDMWHSVHEFRLAFTWMASVSDGADMALEFPLEWIRKPEILDQLTKAKVPRNAWFTCDHPTNGRACGKCLKCTAVRLDKR